jgi:hypothetical protein
LNHDVLRLDPRRLGRTLDDLAEIGNRYSGTPGEAQARDYLLERFGQLGLTNVRLEAFPYLGASPARATCSVVGDGTEIECHFLQYTTPGPVSGEAIYLGEAGEADFRRLERGGTELRGSVVLAHSMFPFDLCTQLTDRGIAGFVHICETPDGIVGNFAGALYPPPLSAPWQGRPVPYTGVTIGHAAGRVLISTLTAGPVEIRLSHDATYAEATAHNVVGEIPAADDGGDPGHVIVCAHYDSQAEGPGIFDNGTGLGSLLECVRVLSESRRRRRIVFIASAAEEIGVWGATAYAHSHGDELDDAAGMVNLDGVASAYPAQREIWSAHAGMAELAARTAREMGWVPDRVLNQRSTFGDHAPFGDVGVPSCLIWRPDYPYYHSRGDVRELVDEAVVAETAAVSASLIGRLSQGADVHGTTGRAR